MKVLTSNLTVQIHRSAYFLTVAIPNIHLAVKVASSCGQTSCLVGTPSQCLHCRLVVIKSRKGGLQIEDIPDVDTPGIAGGQVSSTGIPFDANNGAPGLC